MTDKEKIKAEIERLKAWQPIASSSLDKLCFFLDSLQEEPKDPCKDHCKDHTDDDFESEWNEYFKYRGDVATVNVKHLAKHFFELGLQVRTNKELVEEVYSHLDDIKDTADRMTSGNFMHHRAAIKFSANTIVKVLELIGLKAKKGE